MEVHDLRIGNLVSMNGFTFTVSGVAQNRIAVCTGIVQVEDMDDAEFEDSELPSTSFQPIPITEDWLLKLGFEEFINSFIRPKYHINFDRDCFLEISWNNAEPTNKVCGFAKPEDDDFFSPMWIPINYVHQLQNLYFILLGEELTIKTNEPAR